MSLDATIITIIGTVGIGFTYWFFLGKREKAVAVSLSADSTGSLRADIIVDGGYSPEVISIPRGKTTRVSFLRKDPSACLEEVVLSDFKIRRRLPQNETVTIELTPTRSGTFEFSCGMNMYHGKIIVT